MVILGQITGLACQCSKTNSGEFFYKENRIVCAYCGRSYPCTPPILDVYSATCQCCSSASVKTTFVVDSAGVYTCTWCGRTK